MELTIHHPATFTPKTFMPLGMEGRFDLDRTARSTAAQSTHPSRDG